MATCEAIRVFHRVAFFVYFRDLRGVRLRQAGRVVTLEVLNHALRDQEDRENQRNGQEQIVSGAHEIDPKISDGTHAMARDPADDRRSDGNACRSGNEVMEDQRNHLRKVRHRGFARVILPVGVCREARRRIEGKRFTDGGEFLRIQRKDGLKAQNQVRENHADEAENEHREAVLFPIVLALRIDLADRISGAFQWLKNGIEKRLAAGIENLDQIEAQRFRDRGEHDEIDDQLQPTRGIHGLDGVEGGVLNWRT
jgi:hypothetical protein